MSHPPIPFPTGNIPIVGAICNFHDVQPDVTITCTCDGPFADRLIRFKMWGQVAKCRACGRHMVIGSLAFDIDTQQVQITIKPVVPPVQGSKPS